MRCPSLTVVIALSSLSVIACERRREIPAVGDASTTGASAPRGEQRMEPAVDAGVEPRVAAEQPPPPVPERTRADERLRARERALARAPLTIVQAADRDRNLGVVPEAPARIELDAGGCEVGIEIKRAP